MTVETLVGSRIRQHRQIVGRKQADLAQEVGISASYLNLIEHDRRRISGKLLIQIANSLGVDPALLSEGAAPGLLDALRAADADAPSTAAETDRMDEFVSRFPGWANLVVHLHATLMTSRSSVEAMRDRIAHDPQLSGVVHEVLSTAAAIRSTSSILVEDDALSSDWLRRFHANLYSDSERLAHSSRALAGLLEEGPPASEGEFDGASENGTSATDVHEIGASNQGLIDGLLAEDEASLPLDQLKTTYDGAAAKDPLSLSLVLRQPLPLILRRMAMLPDLEAGYVLCDRAGAVLFAKPLPGFELPRAGALCALWPNFAALGQPGVLIHQTLEHLTYPGSRFDAYAISEAVSPPAVNQPAFLRAGLLVFPAGQTTEKPVSVGASCRICSHTECLLRREPAAHGDRAP